MEHQFAGFVDDVRSTHGANLASVVLYGSAAAGDFIPKHSDYNILIALHKITPTDLREAHACVREWHKMGHPIPVYFTVSELQNAADVFPIEFRQMTVAHKVLYGTDVIANVSISDEFLRHQTEYELRSNLLKLRRQYIPASSSAESLERLMAESLASFAAVFRAVLMLHGISPAVKKRDIVDQIVGNLGLDNSTFDRIFAERRSRDYTQLTIAEANSLFASYMEQIERVIDSVDAIR